MFFPFFFPILPLLVGLFVLLFIFKSGLWIPLLVIGALLFFMRPRGGMSRWGSMSCENWGDKMKNDWRQWQERDDTVITPEKPKRSEAGSTEFV